jgi:hypothetical protein
MALQGNIPAGNQTAEALKKVSNLFTKIAAAKSEVAKAKAQRNRVRATPTQRQTTHLPRLEAPLPRVVDPSKADCHVVPRVANSPQEDCRVEEEVPNPSPPRPVAKAHATGSQSRPLRLSPTWRLNYISQDENDNPPTVRRTTRSTSISIMQEAMLSCVDIYKPKYVLSADLGILNFAAAPKLMDTTYMVTPPTNVCTQDPLELVLQNGKFGSRDNGKLLEYCHLVSNHETRSTWTHSYGNEIG